MFLFKNRTEGAYVIVSRVKAITSIAEVKGNSCALLGQHGAPMGHSRLNAHKQDGQLRTGFWVKISI